MIISRVFAAAAIAATFNLTSVQAETVSSVLAPAESPPASYQGRQYVDSRGCVFVRAGMDGTVTWAPRVTRSRKAICGMQPTFAHGVPVVVAATTTEPTLVTEKAARIKVSRAKVHTAPAFSPGRQHVSSAAQGRYGADQRASEKLLRRYYDAQTRVAPRHVYENQRASLPGIHVPKGYKAAWDDGRLNPRRAHQTLAGIARMDRVWMKTLPRKLIVHRVGVAVNDTGSKRVRAAGRDR